jgi:hypothetical protein
MTALLWSSILLVLFTGPPKFRVRSAEAAAYGEIDVAAMIQLVVWVAAALFTAYQAYRHRDHLHPTKLHKLSVLVIVTMAISIAGSMAPGLTAFKTLQVATAFFFCWIYITRFGSEKFFQVVMIGSLLLCALVIAMLFIDPEAVLSYETSGEARLRGQAIYEVAHPALFGLILLITGMHNLPKIWRLPGGVLFGSALLFSVARIDWLAFATIIGMAVILKADIAGRKWAKAAFWLSPFAAAALLAFLSRMRDLDTLYADSERLGLWGYIILNSLDVSPWIGTGFISGSRLFGMEYSSTLASGHSIFVDALAGCGLLGLAALVILAAAMLRGALRLPSGGCGRLPFTVAAFTVAMLMISLVGAEIEATPFGVLFWGLVTIIAFSAEKAHAAEHPVVSTHALRPRRPGPARHSYRVT